MLRRLTLALIVLTAAATPSAAQERFPRRPGPNIWASLSVGLYQVQNMFDPASNSAWDFGNIVQFRGTLERDFQPGTSLGVALTFTQAPLTYDGPDCSGCDADAQLWQALALFRIGGGIRLHQVIEFGAGVTGFSNFQQRGGGGPLAPQGVIDPTFSIGYGFGYSLSRNTQFMLLQEVGLMVHRRGDQPAGDESNIPRTWATRVGLRVDVGGRR
jgi:hypothetical protein